MPDIELPEDAGSVAPSEGALEAPAAVIAPQPDPQIAELRAMMAQQQQTISVIAEGFNALAANRNAGNVTEPHFVEPTNDQIEQMVAEGKTADAIRLVADARASRQVAALKAESIDPLASQVNNQGIPAMAAMALESAKPSLTHYDRFKGEIDASLNRLAPELRIVPDNVKAAYAIIVGQPERLAQLEREAYERGLRAARENPASLPGAAGRSLGVGGEQVPTAEDIYGKQSQESKMIQAAGGEDAFVQKYFPGRYDGKWENYVALIQNPEGNA